MHSQNSQKPRPRETMHLHKPRVHNYPAHCFKHVTQGHMPKCWATLKACVRVHVCVCVSHDGLGVRVSARMHALRKHRPVFRAQYASKNSSSRYRCHTNTTSVCKTLDTLATGHTLSVPHDTCTALLMICNWDANNTYPDSLAQAHMWSREQVQKPLMPRNQLCVNPCRTNQASRCICSSLSGVVHRVLEPQLHARAHGTCTKGVGTQRCGHALHISCACSCGHALHFCLLMQPCNAAQSLLAHAIMHCTSACSCNHAMRHISCVSVV